MKNLCSFLTAVLLTANVFAQAPEKLSYQTVVRGADDKWVATQTVGMQISILQGSASGASVYVETQTPSSNADGLVSLEIGTGTTSDDFSTIDWSLGSYFIKTETDPTGGTNYTITGISQLMSVPYALYAKTSGNGLSTAQASEITANTAKTGKPTASDAGDMNYWNGSAWVIIPATPNEGATLQMIGDVPKWISGTPVVGDFRYGGVVFWVDGLGGGLVCAKEDQSAGIQWYNGANVTTNATGTVVRTGQANTTSIIAVQGATQTNYAAGLVKAYNGSGYTDWYLPSKDELNQMYLNKATINTTAIANGGSGFANTFPTYYWSSTEYGSNYARGCDFLYGSRDLNVKSNIYRVRAVRAF
jgi:hypothetical protein